MDLFYRFEPNMRRGYGPPTVSEAAQHLSAAAARFAYSTVRAIPQLPAATRQEFLALITVDSLWTLSLVFASWLIATVVGGVIGVAVNLLLIIYGLLALWDEISRVGDDIKAWALAAYGASTDAALDEAGKYFAQALAGGGLTLVQILVTHKSFKAIERSIKKRYPPPKELQQEYEKAARQSEPKKDGDAPLREKAAKVGEKLLNAGEVIASGSRGQGMKKVVVAFPADALLVAGVVAVGAGIALAVTVGSSDKK